MEDSLTTLPLLSWRDVVQRAARETAVIEDSGRWGDARTPFEYRWEHVRAVVRLAIRLAECMGADREVCEAGAWLHDIAKPQSWEHGTDLTSFQCKNIHLEAKEWFLKFVNGAYISC